MVLFRKEVLPDESSLTREDLMESNSSHRSSSMALGAMSRLVQAVKNVQSDAISKVSSRTGSSRPDDTTSEHSMSYFSMFSSSSVGFELLDDVSEEEEKAHEDMFDAALRGHVLNASFVDFLMSDDEPSHSFACDDYMVETSIDSEKTKAEHENTELVPCKVGPSNEGASYITAEDRIRHHSPYHSVGKYSKRIGDIGDTSRTTRSVSTTSTSRKRSGRRSRRGSGPDRSHATSNRKVSEYSDEPEIRVRRKRITEGTGSYLQLQFSASSERSTRSSGSNSLRKSSKAEHRRPQKSKHSQQVKDTHTTTTSRYDHEQVVSGRQKGLGSTYAIDGIAQLQTGEGFMCHIVSAKTA